MNVHGRDGITTLCAGAILVLLPAVAFAASPDAPTMSTGRAATTATSSLPEAKPGSIIRWTGDGIEGCRLGTRTWPAYQDACWIPIDLLVDPGQLVLERTRHGVEERTVVRVGSYPYPTQHLTVAPEMANPPASELDRIRLESERVQALWSRSGPPEFDLPLRPPLDRLPESRSFGSRRVLNGEPRDPHSGIDLSARTGTVVYAAESGLVVLAAEHYFSGRSVFIDHGDELVTMYFHLDRIDVREGDSVERGQVIGAVGTTGRATGPHLHFGARWHGARIDPTMLLGDPEEIVEIATANRN